MQCLKRDITEYTGELCIVWLVDDIIAHIPVKLQFQVKQTEKLNRETSLFESNYHVESQIWFF